MTEVYYHCAHCSYVIRHFVLLKAHNSREHPELEEHRISLRIEPEGIKFHDIVV